MFPLRTGPQAHGTLVDTLARLVGASGLVITLRSSEGVRETIGAVVGAAPRLSEDHDVDANGLIISRVGLYRIVWGVVRHPGGSLAVLVPTSLYEGQPPGDWISHFRIETLDPINTLAGRGYGVGGGGDGLVTDAEFAQAFPLAHT